MGDSRRSGACRAIRASRRSRRSAKRHRTHVAAVVLEQVVRHECGRRTRQRLPREVLAADAELQPREGQGAVAVPREHLAVEDGAIGKRRRCRDDLGKPCRDHFFTARPEVGVAGAPDQLRPNAVPFPLCLPVRARPERLHALLERVRQAERVRPRRLVGRSIWRHQRSERLRRWAPLAHQPVGHHVGPDACDCRQRPNHERLRDSDAHLAGQQLVEQVPLERRQRAPPVHDVLALRLGRLRTQALEPLLDPDVQRDGALVTLRGHAIEEQRERLGEIADRGVRLVEQPWRDARRVLRPLAQQLRRQQPQQSPARQEEDRPCGVLRWRLPEVGLERRHLGVGGRRAVERGVERGETLHSAYASSPCTRASMTPASRPRSAHARASTSAYPCVASTRRAPVAAIVSSSAGQSA